jgi:hypothetical protein
MPAPAQGAEVGAPTNAEDPTIKGTPQAGDPSFKRDAPDVTVSAHGIRPPNPKTAGFTHHVPGSQHNAIPPLSPEKP